MSSNTKFENKISEDFRQVVIARLGTLDPDSKVMLLGEERAISVRDMIKEVKDNTSLGKKIVSVQFSYLKMLASGEI